MQDKEKLPNETIPANNAGDNIESKVNSDVLPVGASVSVPDAISGDALSKVQANNDTSVAQAEAKVEERHQEQLEHEAPHGIDYTNPGERERTLDEHRKENQESWDEKFKK